MNKDTDIRTKTKWTYTIKTQTEGQTQRPDPRDTDRQLKTSEPLCNCANAEQWDDDVSVL